MIQFLECDFLNDSCLDCELVDGDQVCTKCSDPDLDILDGECIQAEEEEIVYNFGSNDSDRYQSGNENVAEDENGDPIEPETIPGVGERIGNKVAYLRVKKGDYEAPESDSFYFRIRFFINSWMGDRDDVITYEDEVNFRSKPFTFY